MQCKLFAVCSFFSAVPIVNSLAHALPLGRARRALRNSQFPIVLPALVFLLTLLLAATFPAQAETPAPSPPPTINTQPSSITVTAPAAAAFSVGATGATGYQWKRNGTDIPGATSSGYTLNPTTLSDSGSGFSVTVSNSNGSVNSNTAILTVKPAAPTIITQPLSVSVTAPAAATFTVVASGATSYQWQKGGIDIPSAAAMNSSYTINPTSTSDSGSYTVRVTNSSGGSSTSVTSNTATLTVNVPLPTITTQPQSQTVTAPAAVTFSVVASGATGYQWLKDGTNIAGTSSSYTISSTTTAHSGSYTVVVSNSGGSRTSSAAILTVNPAPPIITTQPQSQTVTAPAAVTFSVVASGATGYQWQKGGVDIPSAAAMSSSYTINPTSTADSGSYTVRVSNSSGNTTVSLTSNTVTLTVNAPLPIITTQPQSQTVTAPAAVTFSVVASGATGYQWQKDGTNIAGTSSSYTISSTTTAHSGSYTVVVSNSSGSRTSNAAILTVNPAVEAPSIGTQPVNQTVTVGATATFSVTASGTAPLIYKWSRNGSIIAGATSTSYTTPITVIGDNGSTYAVNVSNSAGNVTSSAATLTVNPPPPTITTQPQSQTVTAPAAVTFSVVASGATSYQWQKGGIDIPSAAAMNSSYTINPTSTSDSGSYTVRVTNSSGGSSTSVTSNTATLTVNTPLPIITTQPQSQTVTAPAAVTFSVVASGATGYQWLKDGTNIAGTSSSYTISSTTTAHSGSYTVVVSNSSGSRTSNAAILTVNPAVEAPSIGTQPVNQTVTVGATATFSVTASGTAPLIYKWSRNGSIIAGATSTSYTTPITVIGDNGSTYAVNVSNSAGNVTSSAATLTVNPPPPTITTQPQSQTVTAPAAVTFSVVASGATGYQWLKDGTNIAGTSSSYTISSTTTAHSGSYTVVVSNSGGSRTSSAATLTVNPPAPTITTQPQSQTVTAPAAVTFSVVASGATGYQWQKDGVNIAGTSSSYTISSTTTAHSGSYTVIVSNSSGSRTSSAAILTVNPALPIITTQPQSQTVTAPAAVTFSVVASGATGYQWLKDGTNIAGTSSSYTISSTTTAHSGSYTVVVSNSSGSRTSSAAILTVNSAGPTITTHPASTAVNVGQVAVFNVAATGATPFSYQWKKNGTPIAGATSSSCSITATASDNGALISCTVTNAAGSADSNNASLTVYVPPTITMHPASTAVNVGQVAVFNVAATGTTPFSYQWKKNGTPIAGATSSSCSINATASDNGALIACTVTNAAGSANSNNASLTVNVPPSITTQPASTAVNAGQTATFSVTASGTAPLIYKWSRNGSIIAGATSASYTTPITVIGDNGSTYAVNVSNSAGNITSSAATLTVNGIAPGISIQPANQIVTVGATATFSVTASGTAPLIYKWSRNGSIIAGATSASYTTPITVIGDNGSTYAVNVSNSAGNVTSSAATLTVNPPPPTITTQPQSQTVTAPAAVTFSVVASGATSYQWQKDGVNIAGTSSSYTISSTTTAHSGSYTVVVSNSSGSRTSSAAILTVNLLAPTITTQPISKTVTAPAPATFNVLANGIAVNYQWQRNGVNITSGADTSAYTVNPTATSDSGAVFTVRVYNTTGGVTSSPATLTVNGLAPTISIQPANQIVTVGATATFSVTASGSATLIYKWSRNGSIIAGATSASYTTPITVIGDNGSTYAVNVSNSAGNITSSAATLTVNGLAPTISIQPADTTVGVGQTTTFSVTATGTAPLSKQWRKNGVNISGATLSTYTIPPTVASDDGTLYSVVINNSIGSATSSAAKLTVTTATAPTILFQPVSATVPLGGNFTLSAAATASPSPAYQWLKNGVALTGKTASTVALSNVQSSDAGTYSVKVSNLVGSKVSSNATLTLNMPATISAHPQSQAVALGASALLKVTATSSGTLSYQWRKNGTDMPGRTANVLLLGPLIEADAGNYSVGVYNNLNGSVSSVTSSTATLSVNSPPTITQQPQSLTLLKGTPATLSVTSSGSSPLSYQWRKSGAILTGQTSRTLNFSAAVVGNIGSYDVVISNPFGSVTSSAAALAVLSPPIITTHPASATLPQGASISLNVVATVSGSGVTSYQWQKDGSPLTGQISNTLTLSNLKAPDSGSYKVTISRTLDGLSTSVVSTAAVIAVSAEPVIATDPQAQSVLVGKPASFSVVAQGTGPFTYQWMKTGTPIAGATAATYTIASTVITSAGYYSVKVSNPYGFRTSANALLSLFRIVSPQAQTVNPGDAATFTVSVNGGSGAFTYRWQKNGAGLSDGANVSGSTTATLTLSNVQASDAGVYSAVCIQIINGVSQSEPSLGAQLSVNLPPVITQQPSATTLGAVGNTLVLTVKASGVGELGYQWKRVDASRIREASAVNTSALTLSNIQQTTAGIYNVLVTSTLNGVVSSPVTSRSAIVEIEQTNSVVQAGLTPFVVQINGRRLQNQMANEVDLGSFLNKQSVPPVVFNIQNVTNLSEHIQTVSLTGSGFVLDLSGLQTTLAPGATTSFRIWIDTSVAGIKSGRLTVVHPSGTGRSCSFPIGSLIWGNSPEETDTQRDPPTNAAPGSKFAAYGSELGALLVAKTSAAYQGIRPDLTLEPFEKRIVTYFQSKGNSAKNFAEFIVASKRSLICVGAKLRAKELANALTAQSTLAGLISVAINSIPNDPSARSKGAMVLGFSELYSARLVVRAYTQFVLNNAIVENSAGLNAYGRFYLRAAFFKAYLKTYPPLSEANLVAQTVLSRISDPIAKAPLLDAWAAQYTEALLSQGGG